MPADLAGQARAAGQRLPVPRPGRRAGRWMDGNHQVARRARSSTRSSLRVSTIMLQRGCAAPQSSFVPLPRASRSGRGLPPRRAAPLPQRRTRVPRHSGPVRRRRPAACLMSAPAPASSGGTPPAVVSESGRATTFPSELIHQASSSQRVRTVTYAGHFAAQPRCGEHGRPRPDSRPIEGAPQ